MRDENCIFCKIANGEIPSTTIYEDDHFRVKNMRQIFILLMKNWQEKHLSLQRRSQQD